MAVRGFVLGMVVAVTGLFAACGDSGSSNGSSSGSSACDKACAHCGGDPCSDCKAAAAHFREGLGQQMFECVQGADACGNAWESCFLSAAAAYDRRPLDDQYRDACMAKRSECQAAGTSFADDNCLGSQVLSEAGVQAAQDCLSKPCPDTKTCLATIFY